MAEYHLMNDWFAPDGKLYARTGVTGKVEVPAAIEHALPKSAKKYNGALASLKALPLDSRKMLPEYAPVAPQAHDPRKEADDLLAGADALAAFTKVPDALDPAPETAAEKFARELAAEQADKAKVSRDTASAGKPGRR